MTHLRRPSLVGLFATGLLLATGPAFAQTPEEWRQAFCEESEARDAVFAQFEGDRLEMFKFDVANMCERIDLPRTPRHPAAASLSDAGDVEYYNAARFSPDGRWIVSASDVSTIRVWDTETGQSIRLIGADADGLPEDAPDLGTLSFLEMLGDGSRAVVVSDRYPLRVIDLDGGGILAELDVSPDFSPTAVAAASDLILVGGVAQETIDILDAETLAVRHSLPDHEVGFVSVAVSEAAGLVATADLAPESPPPYSMRIRLWSLENREERAMFFADGYSVPETLTFSRDGARLAVINEGSVSVYSVADQRLVQTFLVHPFFAIFDVAFTADGSGLITCQSHPMLWDIATGEKLRHFGPFDDICQSVDVSPDGRFAVTTHRSTDIRIWEIETGEFHRQLGIDVEPPR